jgi:hypothetical protein
MLFYTKISSIFFPGGGMKQIKRRWIDRRLSLVLNEMKKISWPLFYERKIKDIEQKLGLNSPFIGTVSDAYSALDMKIFVDTMKEPSKLFYLDDLVLDSLYNERHTNVNYENSMRLPFPFMFFEFQNPLETLDIEGNKKSIGGVFYCSNDALSEFYNQKFKHYLRSQLNFLKPDSKPSNKLHSSFFFVEDDSLTLEDNTQIPLFSEDITFDTKNLDFIFGHKNIYSYNFKDKILKKFDRAKYKSGQFSEYQAVDNDKIIEYTQKKIDLMVNIVNYINAQNVVIRKIHRESRSQSDLDRINRKRQRDGKNLINPLKPYYIVEVKKSYVYDEEKEDQGLWSLENRVWVRGHFRHYEDKKPIWIEPFIKGPKDAPWKHNRYAVLYKNFKHLLSRRGNELD